MSSERGIQKKRCGDKKTTHLLTLKQLREVNLALLEGLKLSVHVMKDWGHLEEGRREALIDSVDRLIAQTEVIYQIPAVTTGRSRSTRGRERNSSWPYSTHRTT